MTSTSAPVRPPAPTPRPTTQLGPGARRFGYSLAIVLNAVALWLVHQLVGWGWPGFLTDAFTEALPLLAASLVASIVVNLVFLTRDRGRVRALGDLTTSAFGIAVSLQLLRVFPVDFTGYDHDWAWLVRMVLLVGVIGSAIGAVLALVRLAGGTDRRD